MLRLNNSKFINAPLQYAPAVYRGLAVFNCTAMDWALESAESGTELAQKEGGVASFAERAEFGNIVRNVNSWIVRTPQPDNSSLRCLDLLIADCNQWARGLETRLPFVEKLKDLQALLSAKVLLDKPPQEQELSVLASFRLALLVGTGLAVIGILPIKAIAMLVPVILGLVAGFHANF